jgi:hypothetical protein
MLRKPTLADSAGNVIVVPLVPARVNELLTVSDSVRVSILPSAIVTVAPDAGCVKVSLLIVVAVAAPRTGATKVCCADQVFAVATSVALTFAHVTFVAVVVAAESYSGRESASTGVVLPVAAFVRILTFDQVGAPVPPEMATCPAVPAALKPVALPPDWYTKAPATPPERFAVGSEEV